MAWYELVVHSGTGWNFAGATFPGAPYPLLGHGVSLGWTNTVDRPDLTDLYKLTLNPAGDAYRYDGRWRPLQKQRVWLGVKLWGPFTLPVPRMVYRAVQGPVVIDKAGAFAIRYGGADQLGMVEEYYRLSRARDWSEWSRALAMQGVPATNFLYADATGRIAHVYNASFPNRKPGYDYSHVLPGDTSADYQPGTVPWRMIPQNVNPASGFLINANNTPFQAAGPGSELDPKAFSPLLGIETDTTNRATRAIELMAANPHIDEEALEAIKYDSAIARTGWAPRWFADLARADAKGDRTITEAQALLARWNRDFDGRHPGQALAALLMRTGQKWHYQRLPEIDPHQALADATAYLMRVFHRLDPPLGDMLRLRQGDVDLPLDGAPDVLRASSLWDEQPDGRLAVHHGDSFLMFMTWDRQGRIASRSIQPYGAATTRPASPHYADQAALFAGHRTKPVFFGPAALRANVERVYRP